MVLWFPCGCDLEPNPLTTQMEAITKKENYKCSVAFPYGTNFEGTNFANFSSGDTPQGGDDEEGGGFGATEARCHSQIRCTARDRPPSDRAAHRILFF